MNQHNSRKWTAALCVGACLLLPLSAAEKELKKPKPERASSEKTAKKRGGYLGVSVSRASEELAAHLQLPDGIGLIVQEVMPDSPAAENGLAKNDLLTRLDDQWLAHPDQFSVLIRNHKEGDKVELQYYRGGREKSVSIKLTERELPDFTAADRLWIEGPNFRAFKGDLQKHFQPKSPAGYLGVAVQPIDELLAKQLGLKEDTGVAVTHVVPDSPAQKAGLEKHDLLIQLDGEDIRGPEDFVERVRKHKKGDEVSLTLIRAREQKEIKVELGERRAFDFEMKTWEELPKSIFEPLRELKQLKPRFHFPEKGGAIVLKDSDWALTLRDRNGLRELLIRDPEDKVVFQGPLEDLRAEKLPELIRRHLSDLPHLETLLSPTNEPHPLRILVPKSAKGVI